jgi:hypothetical protein
MVALMREKLWRISGYVGLSFAVALTIGAALA